MSLASALVVVVGLAAFGPPGPLRPHGTALRHAEASAGRGDWDDARAVLQRAIDNAQPEAADLLALHDRMLARLQALDDDAPGMGQRYVPYVFAPDRARLAAAVDDARRLAATDDALQALLATPVAVVVEHNRRAVGLLVRGALLDAARSHGLPLRAAGAGDVVRFTIEQDDVDRTGSILEDSGMHSYTTFVVVEHLRADLAPIENGVVFQLLGINEARAVDSNLDRVVDRALSGLVVEWIRRALVGDLAA
jgi:hypothetical protein